MNIYSDHWHKEQRLWAGFNIFTAPWYGHSFTQVLLVVLYHLTLSDSLFCFLFFNYNFRIFYASFYFNFLKLPTCTDFRGTYRFWPSITISRFHAVVYRFWKMRELLGLADFVLFCFRRYSVILSASCTYRQSRRCVAAINSPPGARSQCPRRTASRPVLAEHVAV